VITEKTQLEKEINEINSGPTNFLFMSSGNYDGLDILQTLKLTSKI
jgi:hypothetical protein